MGRQLRLRRAACFIGWAAVSVVVAPPALAAHSYGPTRTPSLTVYQDDPAGSGIAVGAGSVDTAARGWAIAEVALVCLAAVGAVSSRGARSLPSTVPVA